MLLKFRFIYDKIFPKKEIDRPDFAYSNKCQKASICKEYVMHNKKAKYKKQKLVANVILKFNFDQL